MHCTNERLEKAKKYSKSRKEIDNVKQRRSDNNGLIKAMALQKKTLETKI